MFSIEYRASMKNIFPIFEFPFDFHEATLRHSSKSKFTNIYWLDSFPSTVTENRIRGGFDGIDFPGPRTICNSNSSPARLRHPHVPEARRVKSRYKVSPISVYSWSTLHYKDSREKSTEAAHAYIAARDVP